MGQIKWTLEAEHWLKEIHDYIARNNPTAAQKVVAGIQSKADLLSDFPKIGYKYRDEPDGEIRVLLYGRYRLAYLVKANDDVDILGIFHGAMDISRLL
jgi:toxin ParE1/3/4